MVTMRQRRHREPSAPRAYIDFNIVYPDEREIDRRLQNWARWQRGGSGERARTGDASPTFRLYRSSDARGEGAEPAPAIDKADALRVHFAIVHPTFSPTARAALQWAYLRPRDPKGTADSMGVDLAGLLELVRAGRALLVQLGV